MCLWLSVPQKPPIDELPYLTCSTLGRPPPPPGGPQSFLGGSAQVRAAWTCETGLQQRSELVYRDFLMEEACSPLVVLFARFRASDAVRAIRHRYWRPILGALSTAPRGIGEAVLFGIYSNRIEALGIRYAPELSWALTPRPLLVESSRVCGLAIPLCSADLFLIH